VKTGYLSEVFVSFQGEGAHVGRRHLFVRLAGCNLRCRYCDTPDSLERTEGYMVHRQGRADHHHNPVTPSGIAALINAMLEEEAPIDALALTGGEPLSQSEFLCDVLREARPRVPVLLETNGVLPRRLRDVLALVDIISMDLKLPSNSGEGSFWKEHAEFLALARTRELYVKVLVDQTTSTEDVLCAARILAPIRPEVGVFLQPIVDTAGRPTIDADRLTALFITARSQLSSVRILPQTHKLLGIR
jgi:7-carboxy-7-deazaguanine synthase